LANSPQGKKYNAQALSAELYDVLIKPIEKAIEGKKRLIIIRDAELNYLPFEVLAKQKDDYLLKKYIISYAYSASLLLPVKREQKQGSGLLGFAPFANNSFQQSLFRDKNLGQLPKSGSEVEKIGGDIYLEDEATKKRFYETYRNKNVIHFATHATTDDTDPLKSFIAFYPDSADYKLFTNELYDLDLRNTSLVMLSACETGAGKLQKGEGVMSLSRAFTYAGAKAVITTLWNAHDEASAYISERFYKHLKGGIKTDEALRQAKLDFLSSDLALRYEHPYYWANFILIGPAETIDFGTNWWVWGFSIIFLLFLIFMVTKFRGKSISPKQAETRNG
uniref:CHAT domain-containing protein n=1 Tax=Emticicia sp. TaxID=1930953 RepID=UPI003BA74981